MAGIQIRTASQVTPQCYAYTTPDLPSHEGWTKIGFTERDVKIRVKEQTHTVGVEAKIWWNMRASFMTEPFGTFTDRDFHAYLKKMGVDRRAGTEWFRIHPDEARQDFLDFAQNHGIVEGDREEAVIPYVLREEQDAAVRMSLEYFRTHEKGEFLWNAKPRFGKTLSAYDLCKRLGAENILIVTNRPAIANSWYSDYETFFGPESGYLFVSTVEGIKDRKFVLNREEYIQKLSTMEEDRVKGCIEFVSLQDLKGSLYFGGQYDKLEEISAETGIVWDILIIDEAHEGVDTYKTDTAFNQIARKHTLHLSGTPFKALANDKFPSDAIFNWTYADEQKKKGEWDPSREEENPYENLPRLSLYTYQMSEVVRDRLESGIALADQDVEEYAFDLNEFFRTNESGKFVHDRDVNRFLDALTKQEKFPFSTPELRAELKHSFWLLNRVASAKALAKKLEIHPVFKDYEIILAAGDGKLDEEAETAKAFDRVTRAIRDYDKTITLSVGQLTTGVTVPEWTAVLMLSNMASPSLYMQAAFRAQNPCLFRDKDGNSYRKKNAYVFDFDPARTLTIFEQFANDLIPESSGERIDFDGRKEHVRELLNFFPVYGEDDQGEMVELDAEKVLTIPRHIHAKEVVDRGFMSNFLFANISGIFNAPKEVIDLIQNMEPIEEKRAIRDLTVTEGTGDELDLNSEGSVEISREKVIGLSANVFGKKVYETIDQELKDTVDRITEERAADLKPEKEELEELQKKFSRPITGALMETAKLEYGRDLSRSTQKRIEKKIQGQTDGVVNQAYGEYSITRNRQEREFEEEMDSAREAGATMEDLTRLENEQEARRQEEREAMVRDIHEKLQSQEIIRASAEIIVETVETEKRQAVKQSIESDVRDHLRGFSRTIPAFLMAYGDENTTLANFDALVPPEVFWEVTVNPKTDQGVTLDNFRFLRDGGDYYERDENGREIRDEEHRKHFHGQLFDEVVFNDAVAEFMRRRKELANYFDEEVEGDIFDYIPNQRTNQIFTPKKVVMEMVDRLEKENPGCFDDPEASFADLYMKSGMYITAIVTRLFQSDRLKALFPDESERLNHIFAHQIYGCAPTEIIYRICLRYILGFSKTIQIDHHNLILCDTMPLARDGKLYEELEERFGLS